MKKNNSFHNFIKTLKMNKDDIFKSFYVSNITFLSVLHKRY